MVHRSIFSPFRVVLLFTLITLAGFWVLPHLSVNLLPEVKNNEIVISYRLPNSSPESSEEQVTTVLEGAFSRLSQLKKIASSSGYDEGNVHLVFDKGTDMQFKMFEIRSLLRSIYPNLPQGTSYPEVSQGQPDDKARSPLLVYTISGPDQGFEIRRTAEDIYRKAMVNLKGIERISVTGSGHEQLTILFDIGKCHALHISPSAIRMALNTAAYSSFPGSLTHLGGNQYFMEVPALLTSIKDVRDLMIRSDTGVPFQLKDIASVTLKESPLRTYYRINQKTAVTMQIFAQSNQNNILLAQRIKNIVSETRYKLPSGYQISLSYDNTEFLKKEMDKNYWRAGLSMLILLIFILLSYRNLRYLIVLFSSLIVNLALTALLAYATGLSVHLYTIAGLAIAFGIMIDNAIVMIDYYHQYKNRSVFLALLAATLTTIAALCLIFLLPEDQKNNLADFALMIVLALASSMPVALFFTPAFYELLFAKKKGQNEPNEQEVHHRLFSINSSSPYYRVIRFISTYRKWFALLVILIFGLPLFLLPTKLEGNKWYDQIYNQTIGSTIYQHKIAPVTNKILGGSLRLFSEDVFENSGYRTPEKTRLFVIAQLPIGNTPRQMNAVISRVENYLSQQPGVDQFITNIQSGQYGIVEIHFKDEGGPFPNRLKTNLIALSLDWGGVDWNIYGVGEGFSNKGGPEPPDYRIKMMGYNYLELKQQAGILAKKLAKHRHIYKINTNAKLEYYEKASQEFVLNLNAERLAMAGLHKTQTVSAIKNLSIQNTPASFLTLNNQNYPVVIEEKNANQFSNFTLLHKPIEVGRRDIIVNSFGALNLETVSPVIKKEDRQYVRVVSFKYTGARKFGEKYLNQAVSEMSIEMPIGFTAEETSFFGFNNRSKSHEYFLIIILILTNFFICSVLFEGLVKPLLIIVMIPISFIGLFLVFSMGGFYFDQGGYAAFVMLGGLVVNAAIFIVNDFLVIKRKYPEIPVNNLLIYAVANRARTILITTASTCCGLIPFLLEGQKEAFWFSFAIGTIGGMVFSMFAVFVVLPTLLWNKKEKKQLIF